MIHSMFTREQRQHVRWCLAYSLNEPTDEQQDEAFLNSPLDCPYMYYAPTRTWFSAELRSTGIADAVIRGKWIYTHEVLNAEQIMQLELLPIGANALIDLLIAYYEQAVPAQYQGSSWVLYNPRRQGRGAIIHPSTRVSEEWQLTLFFADGPSAHGAYPTRREAIRAAINWGRCTMPGPHLLDKQIHHWRIPFSAVADEQQ
jgi:hypothetical protein